MIRIAQLIMFALALTLTAGCDTKSTTSPSQLGNQSPNIPPDTSTAAAPEFNAVEQAPKLVVVMQQENGQTVYANVYADAQSPQVLQQMVANNSLDWQPLQPGQAVGPNGGFENPGVNSQLYFVDSNQNWNNNMGPRRNGDDYYGYPYYPNYRYPYYGYYYYPYYNRYYHYYPTNYYSGWRYNRRYYHAAWYNNYRYYYYSPYYYWNMRGRSYYYYRAWW